MVGYVHVHFVRVTNLYVHVMHMLTDVHVIFSCMWNATSLNQEEPSKLYEVGIVVRVVLSNKLL